MLPLNMAFHRRVTAICSATIGIRTMMIFKGMLCVNLLKMPLHFSLLAASMLASSDGTDNRPVVVFEVMTEIARELKRW